MSEQLICKYGQYHDAWPPGTRKDCAYCERDKLKSILNDVAGCGLELEDDPRMHYLTVQIDRELWVRIQEAVK